MLYGQADLLCNTYQNQTPDLIIPNNASLSDYQSSDFENKKVVIQGVFNLNANINFQSTIFECSSLAFFSGGSHNVTFNNCQIYHCTGSSTAFAGFNFSRGSSTKKLRFFRTKVHNYHQINIDNSLFEAVLTDFRYSDFAPTGGEASIMIINNQFDARSTLFEACALGDLQGDLLIINHSIPSCFICGSVELRGNQMYNISNGGGISIRGAVVQSFNNSLSNIFNTSFSIATAGDGILISSGDLLWGSSVSNNQNFGIFSNALFAIIANTRFSNIKNSVYSNGPIFIHRAEDNFDFPNTDHNFLSAFNTVLAVSENIVEVNAVNNAKLLNGILVPLSFGWIEKNEIMAPELSTSRGIYVSSPTSLTFNYGTSIALNNLINCGISLNGSDKHLWSNTVNRSANAGITASLAPFNRYCFNNLTGGIGMNFSGNCDNSAIFKNKFFGGVTGLRANDMLGDQHINAASEIERTMNEWTGTYSDLGARHTGNPNIWSNSRFFHNGASIYSPTRSPFGWFPELSGLPEKYSCSDDLYKHGLRDIEVMVIKDSVISSPVSQWMLRKQTFYELAQKPDILANDKEAEDWYKKNEYLYPLIEMHRQLDKIYPDSITRIKMRSLVHEIDSLHTTVSELLPAPDSLMTMAEYDSLYLNLHQGIVQMQADLGILKDSLADIIVAHLHNKSLHYDSAYMYVTDFTPADSIEWLEKEVYKLYLYYTNPDNTDTLSVGERSFINETGALCPEDYGHAVWMARDMMYPADRDSIVEDCQLSSRSRKAKDIFVKDNEIQIYPNPTTNTLRINSKNVLEKIEIFNFMGVMVQGEYSPDTEIDISMLAPNVYFLRTTRADGGIAIVKFIKVMD